MVDPESTKVTLIKGQAQISRKSCQPKNAKFSDVSGTRILNEFWAPPLHKLHFGVDVEDAFYRFSPRSLHYMVSHLGASELPKDVDYSPIIRALTLREAVGIRYVSLRKGGQATDRIVFPMILRVIGDQLALSAYDSRDLKQLSGTREPPLKTFVLFRMLDVKPVRQTGSLQDAAELIENFAIGREPFRSYRVTLNSKLSQDQGTVLRRELGLDANNRKLMDSALLFQFKAQYMIDRDFSELQSDDHVWPIVESIEAM